MVKHLEIPDGETYRREGQTGAKNIRMSKKKGEGLPGAEDSNPNPEEVLSSSEEPKGVGEIDRGVTKGGGRGDLCRLGRRVEKLSLKLESFVLGEAKR